MLTQVIHFLPDSISAIALLCARQMTFSENTFFLLYKTLQVPLVVHVQCFHCPVVEVAHSGSP